MSNKQKSIDELMLLLKGQDVLDYLSASGGITSNDLIKMQAEITKLEAEVNKHTITTYTANRLSEIEKEIDSLKATLSTHENIDHSALQSQLDVLKQQYAGITSSTLMTDKDRQDIIATFNGLKNNVFRQLSAAHQALTTYIDNKVLSSEKELVWIPVYDRATAAANVDVRELIKTFAPSDKFIVKYASNIIDTADFTQTETNDVSIALVSTDRQDQPETNVVVMKVDGSIVNTDNIMSIRKQVLK